jgi:DNA-binding response OmpR family regulator
MRDAPESGRLEAPREAPSLLRFGGFILDLDAHTLVRDTGEAVALTRGEFALLRAFVARPGRVLTRDTLLDALASRQFEPFDPASTGWSESCGARSNPNRNSRGSS